MLLSNFNLLATAPGGVARLRELILTLAVQGKLVPQNPGDEPASVLLQKIRVEKDQLIAEGKIRRDKPLAAIADEDKPFELPLGWEWMRLGALLPFRIGKTPPSKDPQYWGSEGHAWVSISDMEHFGEIRETQRKITDKGAAVFGYDPLPIGTLIMSFKLTIGKISVLQLPAFHNEAIISFQPLVGLNTEFLKYSLPTVSKTGASKNALMGQTLNTESLSNLIIAVPPTGEQARIVIRVEELMHVCDALEVKGKLEAAQHIQLVSTLLGTLTGSDTPEALADNWQHIATHFDLLLDRPEAIDAFEQTILQLAVRGLLVSQDPIDEPASILLQKIRAEKDRLIAEGKIRRDKPLAAIADEEKPFELPRGWEWVRCSDYFFELCTGPFGSVIHQEDYVRGGVPLINPSHMLEGRIVHDPRVTLNPKDAERLSAYALSAGDIVLARRGEVGRYALVTEREHGWLCGTGSFFARLHATCNREYLGLLFTDNRFRQHLQGQSVGMTMTNLNQGILLDALIAVPPLAEQSRIVTGVEELRRLCADLRQRLSASQTTQAHLAETLVESVAG